MMDLRRVVVIVHETHQMAGQPVDPPTRQVVACAVLGNPLAGRGYVEHLDKLIELSFDVGVMLTARALKALAGVKPQAYGKAVIVGTAGELEHGAAMIHPRLGFAMRQGIGGGKALIPGVKKVAGPGATIDLAFGDIDEPWAYDSMDAIEISVPGAPKPDEILLAVGFAVGGRPNARVRGATPAQAAASANPELA